MNTKTSRHISLHIFMCKHLGLKQDTPLTDDELNELFTAKFPDARIVIQRRNGKAVICKYPKWKPHKLSQKEIDNRLRFVEMNHKMARSTHNF